MTTLLIALLLYCGSTLLGLLAMLRSAARADAAIERELIG